MDLTRLSSSGVRQSYTLSPVLSHRVIFQTGLHIFCRFQRRFMLSCSCQHIVTFSWLSYLPLKFVLPKVITHTTYRVSVHTCKHNNKPAQFVISIILFLFPENKTRKDATSHFMVIMKKPFENTNKWTAQCSWVTSLLAYITSYSCDQAKHTNIINKLFSS